MEHNDDGVSYYDGDWLDNVRQGYGVRRYASSNVYDGMWYKNRRHGLGTMHWFDRSQSYTGSWEDGVQVMIIDHCESTLSHYFIVQLAKAAACDNAIKQYGTTRQIRYMYGSFPVLLIRSRNFYASGRNLAKKK